VVPVLITADELVGIFRIVSKLTNANMAATGSSLSS
jgi:hypothetical protein